MSSEEQQDEQLEVAKSEPSELDKAAYDLKYVMPRALALAANMKAGGLNRVFSTLLQYPIIDKPKRFRSQAETELFFMSVKLMNSKSIILNELKPQLEGVVDEAADLVVEEKKDQLLGRMRNGSN